MNKLKLGTSDLEVSEISLGCMRMNNLSKQEANKVIENALENGIDFFDHADIYGGGTSEEIFADAIDMNPSVREKMIIQTKCGIRPGVAFDFSKTHILHSVEGSLKRLNTDYIDVLLLHRPDALVEPEEVAEAFAQLKESGKVRHFGVSNQNPMQIELLKKYVEQDLIVNQLQLSVMFTPMIDAGLNVNMQHDPSVVRDGSILDYSRLNDMTIQAWSPFQYGMFQGVFVGNEKFPEVNAKLTELADKYSVTESAIAIAWILRHPANIQPIVGTMNTKRLTDIAKASNVKLSREEWYEIYMAAGNKLP
ncbi:aldo/keto reductase [Aquibacillus salsiterrae]|uniref:Aldo/keto reductase family oxidoreductase n=1 Tax=Aquibacillus salsiterrae TaxID=2950439 RepID=A0A9X3WCL7_9BACI|nr:aldo/keto reductase family oxidoreductase [Aquibacillus salsiterrae]MDC3417365.1 aldo/keto reductase family oxidoreductase [Aquibacillus salsiterrae]